MSSITCEEGACALRSLGREVESSTGGWSVSGRGMKRQTGMGAVVGSSLRYAISVELPGLIIYCWKAASQSTQFSLHEISVFLFADVVVLLKIHFLLMLQCWKIREECHSTSFVKSHLLATETRFSSSVCISTLLPFPPLTSEVRRGSVISFFIVQKSLQANWQILQTHWPLRQSWHFPQCHLTSEEISPALGWLPFLPPRNVPVRAPKQSWLWTDCSWN